MGMYEARQHKEKVSRAIGGSGKGIRQHKNVLQKMLGGRNTSNMELRPRKLKDNGNKPPTQGYRNLSECPKVLAKDLGSSRVLWWTDAKQNKEIATDGNRAHDLQQVPQASSGHVWHHSEMLDVSGRCYMQEVPEVEHESISHIGAINQYNDKGYTPPN